MESKYKERAEKLILQGWESYINSDIKFKNLSQEERDNWINMLQKYNNNSVLIKAMCKLAEEVEANYHKIQEEKLKELSKDFVFKIPEITYTKEQVEELLEKQRESCANQPPIRLSMFGKMMPCVSCSDVLNTKLKLE